MSNEQHTLTRQTEYGVKYGDGLINRYADRSQAERKIVHIETLDARGGILASQRDSFFPMELVEREVVITTAPWKPVAE